MFRCDLARAEIRHREQLSLKNVVEPRIWEVAPLDQSSRLPVGPTYYIHNETIIKISVFSNTCTYVKKTA